MSPEPVSHELAASVVLYRQVAVTANFLATRDGVTFGGDVRISDLTGDIDGEPPWRHGEGGDQPSRPMSVAVHDFDGDGAAEVVCFWHRPQPGAQTDWQELADVVVQIRDGRTGEVIREAVPAAVTERCRRDPAGANWVYQRLLIANFRGLDRPRWIEYGNSPAYIPVVGDLNGDGRDEVNGG